MSTVLIRVRSAVALAALVLLLAVTPARAQWGMGGGDPSQFTFPVSKRNVEDYAKRLAMTPEQREGALALYDGYKAGVKSVRDEMQKTMREMMEKVSDSGDWSQMKDVGEAMKPLGEKLEKLDSGLLTDIKALLTEEQAAKFPKIERMRRRDKDLKFSFVSGTRVDLVAALESIKVNPEGEARLAEAVEAYEIDLDRALVTREQAQKDEQEKAGKNTEKMMQGDMSAVGDMFKRFQEIERPIRDLNKSHARKIGDLLPEAKRGAFEDEFKRRAFPRVYRESPAQKAFAAAEKLEDLTGAQKESIADLKAQYTRESGPINTRWAEAIEERDNKGFNPMEMFMGGGGEGKENPVAEQRKARRELDRATRKKLEGVLTESQLAKLPEDKANMQQDMMENMGMDFDLESLQAAEDE
jgi:Spy/CpxP family protein refolding chaperone